MTNRERVLAVLADGPASGPEIERATGMSKSAVRETLRRARAGGSVVEARVGRTQAQGPCDRKIATSKRWRLATDAD